MVTDKVNRAVQLQQQGQNNEAYQLYAEVLEEDPTNENALVNTGVLLFQVGQYEKGIRLLNEAVKHHPASSNAAFNMGYALIQSQKLKAALPLLQKSVELDPQLFRGHLNLGNTYSSLGQHQMAFKHYLESYKLQPKSLELLNNWAKTCIELKNYEQGQKILDKALQWYPTRAELYGNQATIYKNQWKMAEAEENFLKAIEFSPGDWRLLNALGTLYHTWNRFDDAIIYFEKALKLDPKNEKVHSNVVYFKNYFPQYTNKEHFENHQNWAKTHAPKQLDLKANFSKETNQPLRVGLLSGDFNRHPVTVFLLGWLEKTNNTKLNFYAYTEIQHQDDYTDKVKNHCVSWFETNAVSDAEIASKIQEDKIDILIDLAGHTKANRLPVMAYKAAPVQISYLGYINTTGLDQIDFRLVDRFVNPEESQQYYSEKLLYLDRSYTCYTPPEYHLPVSDSPVLDNGHITFGSFNNPSKYNQSVIALWSNLLRAVPNSRLLLKARHFGEEQGVKTVADLFDKDLIESKRIIFEGASSFQEYFESYSRIDIALDPFPHNGGTTSHDALYMGVPLLTFEGESYVSRMGVSILNHLGHPEWISKDENQFIATAKAICENPKGLNTIRRGLRDEFLKSSLCDAQDFADKMESLLEELVESR